MRRPFGLSLYPSGHRCPSYSISITSLRSLRFLSVQRYYSFYSRRRETRRYFKKREGKMNRKFANTKLPDEGAMVLTIPQVARYLMISPLRAYALAECAPTLKKCLPVPLNAPAGKAAFDESR